jgi:hypothetical protein
VEPDSGRLAAGAWPTEQPGHGRWAFILDESSAIGKKDLRHSWGTEVFPIGPVEGGR